MEKKIKIIGAILLVIAWMLVIYNFSSKSSNESNEQSKDVIKQVMGETIEKSSQIQNIQTTKLKPIVEKLNVPFRKCAHASIYFVLAILIMIFMVQTKNKKIVQCNIITIVICILYACTDEYHQTFVMGRTGKITDVLIDTVGAMLGCFIFNMINKKTRKNITKKLV